MYLGAMRSLTRFFTLWGLVLVIAVASVQLAAARGQAPAVDTMVICTGSGPVHILFDENGVPTGGVMVCPDYALAFFANTSVTTPEALRSDLWQRVWTSRTAARAAEQPAPASQARGPPFFV
ncbi:hypothetical protein MWU54_06255 [Marivita sp. S6314]|uniref:hypothetical protein n=1 Tax=Marivita sp. S6314 TaxID=2926406 RepID=UPI001FF16C0E|nr:hypothetical protein [Marivita sp. S6314]MCK0149616.1 hypothetical protein [Marivita sp. S6314]